MRPNVDWSGLNPRRQAESDLLPSRRQDEKGISHAKSAYPVVAIPGRRGAGRLFERFVGRLMRQKEFRRFVGNNEFKFHRKSDVQLVGLTADHSGLIRAAWQA